MTLDALIMLCGTLVAVLPFLGFPNTWDSWIFFALGIFVVALGIVVRRRRPADEMPMKRPTRRQRPVFAQSQPPVPQQFNSALSHDESIKE